MDEDILLILVLGLIMFIGVAGITIRLALKPVVDSVARLMEARAGRDAAEILERRVTLLERELESIRSLAEGKAFDRTLGG